MTVAELAAELPEEQLYDACIAAAMSHPWVAELRKTTFNGSGTFIPRGGGRARFITVGFRGQPDLTGFTRTGRIILLEVKRPGEKPRVHQQAYLDFARKHNAVAGCVHSARETYELIDNFANR